MESANSPTGYANPDAVTQIANGLSTTTYSYDNDGNLISSGNGTATTTYTYDYANRLIALFAGGATTSYAYDAFGQRVLQTGTSTTTLYPFKWYSVASSTGSGAKYATTTSYVFNGDTLLATVDQQTASGVATGTAQTRFIHPDHLGSTNVVTNASGTVVQTLDYYPYGAARISTNTGGADSARKYIGQFADQSNFDYLNARYYDSSRGEFLTEDPVFWGNPKNQTLANPQGLNTYSYSFDNPITGKDPSGLLREQSAVNITRNLIADLFAFANNLAAYVNSLAHNPSQGFQSAGQAVNSIASNPAGFARSVVSGAGQSASRTWSMINSGNDADQERGIANWIEFSGSMVAGPAGGADAAASESMPQVLLNKAAGDAFRDSVAQTLQSQGRVVQTEVRKQTGLGTRIIDIQVSDPNGKILGGVETKLGNSPYLPSQRAKDAWLRWTSGYIVNVIRGPNQP